MCKYSLFIEISNNFKAFIMPQKIGDISETRERYKIMASY